MAVIGAGQAGLAVSHELTELGIEHVVLERGRVGQTWRDRWDSFCLVRPNWRVQLPGGDTTGRSRTGSCARRDRQAPRAIRRRRACTRRSRGRRRRASGDGFVLRTSTGDLAGDALVVATGTYRRPHLPPAAETLPAGLRAADGGRLPLSCGVSRMGPCSSSAAARRAASSPRSCTTQAGRSCSRCGRAPWLPRRPGGRDLVWWLHETGFLDDDGRHAARPGGAPVRECPGDGPRRRPRPPSPGAPRPRRHAVGTLRRSGGRRRPSLRRRPR